MTIYAQKKKTMNVIEKLCKTFHTSAVHQWQNQPHTLSTKSPLWQKCSSEPL